MAAGHRDLADLAVADLASGFIEQRDLPVRRAVTDRQLALGYPRTVRDQRERDGQGLGRSETVREYAVRPEMAIEVIDIGPQYRLAACCNDPNRRENVA